MARAVVARQLGRPESFTLESFDPGHPSPGKVRVAIHAAGVSYVDVLTASGGYQVKPPVPFVPGSECAGVIEAVGEGVSEARLGERVMINGWGGMFAEYGKFPAEAVRRIPDAMSFEEAAVFPVSYSTAYYALAQRGNLQPGETLLILGAAGATGYAAAQLGLAMGAKVIASASGEEKRKMLLSAGVDAVVNSRSPNWREDVKAANGGNPVNVVFDPVGGDATDLAFRSLAWKGRHLIIGFPAGIAALKTNLPLLKGASLIGVDIRQFGLYETEQAAANMAALMMMVEQRKLRPAISARFPLDRFAEAMNRVSAGVMAGRVVLTMAK